MRALHSLRGRLIALVIALLAIVIGGIAVVSTGVVHYEIRKLEVHRTLVGEKLDAGAAVREYFQLHRSWTGVQPSLEQAARSAGSDVALFDGQRRLVATAPRTFRPSRIEVTRDGALTYEQKTAGGRSRRMLRGPQLVIRDGRGAEVGFLFVLPEESKPDLAPRRTV
ncbi:MAG: hypothetical protein ABIP63_05055, partial [Thermoanaerobaculia bacterium]